MNDHAKAIEEFIVNEITAGLEAGALPHDEDLLAADLIDSLGITELVSFLESRFGISVTIHAATPVATSSTTLGSMNWIFR